MTGIDEAKDLLKAGQLSSAIEQVVLGVKGRPTDVRLRTLLFELLCFSGDWTRAEKQLEVIAHQNLDNEIGVQVYRNAIKAERDRRRVLRDGGQPYFFIEPPTYVDLQLKALAEMRTSHGECGREAYMHAKSQWPTLRGKLNGKDFSGFRDCSDVLGPILEVIVRDQYAWLPFEHISRIDVDSPKKLRDSIWVSAQIEMIDGTAGRMFIPAIYTSPVDHSDEDVKLGRRTDWQEIASQVFEAVGLRMFFTDEFEQPILGTDTIEFYDLRGP